MVSVGSDGLNFEGIGRIILSLIGSPILAICTGFVVMSVLFRIFGRFSPSTINHRFKKMQILSASMMAFSHGSNDAQKSMGIITLALLSGGYIDVFEVPTYVKVLLLQRQWPAVRQLAAGESSKLSVAKYSSLSRFLALRQI